MIELRILQDAILLPVRARAGAKVNAISGIRAGRLCVSVTQAPEKGKANAAIVKVLARGLGLKRSQVALHSGEISPRKQFRLTGVTETELRERLSSL